MAEELTYQQVMQMFAETDRRMREGFEELKEGDKRLQRDTSDCRKNTSGYRKASRN